MLEAWVSFRRTSRSPLAMSWFRSLFVFAKNFGTLDFEREVF